MLSSAYFLAKFRFDTAENEPAKNLQKFAKFANVADPNPLTLTRSTAQVGLEGGPGRLVARRLGVAVLAFRGRSLTARGAGRSERASPAKFMQDFLKPFSHSCYVHRARPFFFAGSLEVLVSLVVWDRAECHSQQGS